MKFQEMNFQPKHERGLWHLKCASTETGSPEAYVPNLGTDLTELNSAGMALRRGAHAV
jgi:hypothetical protein